MTRYLVFFLLSSFFCVKASAQFTIYNTANSDLPFNSVNCILPQGNAVWVGTEYGLAKLENGTWTVWQTTTSNIPDNAVRALYIDSLNRLWIGTFQHGASYLTGADTWTTFETSNSGIASNQVRAITFDSLGVGWFATTNGLSRFDGTAWHTYNQQNTPVMRSNNITTLAVDSANRLWYGTINGGLGKLVNGATATYWIGNAQITDNTVQKIWLDEQENKWMATPSGGISIYYNNGFWDGFSSVNTPEIYVNTFFDVIKLPSNHIILASQGAGLLYNYSGQWDSLTVNNSNIPEMDITCLSIVAPDKLWLGTRNNGVAVLDMGFFTSVTNSIPSADDFSICPNPCKDFINIESSKNEEFTLYDNLGKEIARLQNPIGVSTFDTSKLPAGIYFLKTNSNNKPNFKIIVKQ